MRSHPLSPVERNGDVQPDAVHPGGKLYPSVEPSEGPPELEQDLLRQILAIVWLAAIGATDLIEDLLVFLYKLLEPRLPFSRSHASHYYSRRAR
jgi:hypothetical protein